MHHSPYQRKYSSTHIYTTSLKNTQMMITQLLYSETSTQYSTTTKTSCQVNNTREVASVNPLITHLDLQDSRRILHPEEKQYTWDRAHPFTARRIDYLFISSGLTANIEQSEIISFPHSDHRAVTLTLVRHDYKRGPFYRKFNNSLLKDTKYVNHTNNTNQIFSQETVEANIDPHAK